MAKDQYLLNATWSFSSSTPNGTSSTNFQRAEAAKYPNGYLHRIEEWITEKGHNFYNLTDKQQFLNALSGLPDSSLTRLYFSGHASDHGLWLDLIHTNHVAQGVRSRILTDTEIAASIAGKTKPDARAVSMLLGCNTSETAETISKQGLIVEGSQNAIHFGYIENNSIGDGEFSGNLLERVTNGTIHGISPDWTQYGN